MFIKYLKTLICDHGVLGHWKVRMEFMYDHIVFFPCPIKKTTLDIVADKVAFELIFLNTILTLLC